MNQQVLQSRRTSTDKQVREQVSGKIPKNGPASTRSGIELQRALGNRTVQAKLTVGRANDRYEREADAVAAQVMSMADPWASNNSDNSNSLGLSGSSIGSSSLQRKCADCAREEKEKIQRKPLVGKTSTAGVSDLNQALRQGQPIPDTDRQFFNARFNRDFSPVRLHTGDNANHTAAQFNARAFTHGTNIVFNRGEYKPGNTRSRYLLAHELTHVIQQSDSGNVPTVQRTTTRGAGGCGSLRSVDEDADGARAAGRTAHTQIQSFLLPGIANELTIPRATKRRIDNTGCQSDSVTEGRADLWKPGSIIGIAEIKPFGFATRNHIAQQEADHYIRRARQSVDRSLSSGTGAGRCGHQPAGADDQSFAHRIGMSGGIAGRKRFTRLRGVLPTATVIGSFDGDRTRTLKARMTEAGSVGYWCTGGRSNTYPCDATGRETEEYIDSILSNAQDLLDDFIRDRIEEPLEDMLESFDMARMLRFGKRHFWPRIRDAIREELGPAGGIIPDDISTDELARIIDEQLGPTGRVVVLTLIRRFKSLFLNEIRRLLRNALRTMIRNALIALCVGAPVVTLASLFDKLKKMFEQEAKRLVPIAVNVALVSIAAEILREIAEAVKEIGGFILRALAIIALVIVALAALLLLAIAIVTIFTPVPGDEVAAGAGSLLLAELAAALAVFIVTGEMPEEDDGA